ncbi:MAG: hypothetical protein ABSE99_09870 [Terracidiphilus sp.]
MQIAITVSDEILREAESRGIPVIDFVESLITRGMEVALDRNSVASAIQRIRALRSTASASKD